MLTPLLDCGLQAIWNGGLQKDLAVAIYKCTSCQAHFVPDSLRLDGHFNITVQDGSTATRLCHVSFLTLHYELVFEQMRPYEASVSLALVCMYITVA